MAGNQHGLVASQDLPASVSHLDIPSRTLSTHRSEVNENSADNREMSAAMSDSESTSSLSSISKTPSPYRRPATNNMALYSMANVSIDNGDNANSGAPRRLDWPDSEAPSSPLSVASRTPSPFRSTVAPETNHTEVAQAASSGDETIIDNTQNSPEAGSESESDSEADFLDAISCLVLRDASDPQLPFDTLYQKAIMLARERKFEDAKDFIFELKMRGDFTPYNRLMCNILEIQLIPIHETQSLEKVLLECWHLVQEMKSSIPDVKSFSMLVGVEATLLKLFDIGKDTDDDPPIKEEPEAAKKGGETATNANVNSPEANVGSSSASAEANPSSAVPEPGIGSDGRLTWEGFDENMRMHEEMKEAVGDEWGDPSKSAIHRPETALPVGQDLWTNSENILMDRYRKFKANAQAKKGRGKKGKGKAK